MFSTYIFDDALFLKFFRINQFLLVSKYFIHCRRNSKRLKNLIVPRFVTTTTLRFFFSSTIVLNHL